MASNRKYKYLLPRKRNEGYSDEIIAKRIKGNVVSLQDEITHNVAFLTEFHRGKKTKEQKMALINAKCENANIHATEVGKWDEDTSSVVQATTDDLLKHLFERCSKEKHRVQACGSKGNELKPSPDEVHVVTMSKELLDKHSKKKSFLQLLHPSALAIRDGLDYVECDFPTNRKWFQHYSCIHNIFESFDFHVYHATHLTDTNTVHRCARYTIRIPASPNFFILFNGFLAHNGAASKREPHGRSFNHARDVRAFSYIQREGYPLAQGSPEAIRGERQWFKNKMTHRGRSYHFENHTTDASVSSTVYQCFAFVGRECKTCNKVHSKLKKSKEYVLDGKSILIDIGKIYESLKKKSKDDGSSLVAGNLDEHGWEVHYGHQIAESNVFQASLDKDIMHVCNHIKSKWRVVQTPSRKTYNVLEHTQTQNESIPELFYNIMKVVRKIPDFEHAETTGCYLIQNDGIGKEQGVHRDYEQREYSGRKGVDV